MQTYKCCGNYPAFKICNNQLCEQNSPFLCDNNFSECHCNEKHCHDDEAATIKHNALFDKINKIINLFQSKYINELDEVIDKIILKVTNQLKSKKEQILNELMQYLSNYLKLPVEIKNNFIKIENSLSDKLTGKIVHKIHKELKSENKISEIEEFVTKNMQQARNLFKMSQQQFHQDIQKIRFNLSKYQNEEKLVLKKEKNQVKISNNHISQFINLIENTPCLNFNGFRVESISDQQFETYFQYFFSFSLNNLTVLNLNNNKLNDYHIKKLIGFNIPNLEQLKLMANQLGQDAPYYLARGKWEKIFYFNLSSNLINSRYFKDFVTAFSTKLKRLDIDYNRLDAKAVIYMINAKWPLLTELHIYGNESLSKNDNEILQMTFGEQIKKATTKSQIRSQSMTQSN